MNDDKLKFDLIEQKLRAELQLLIGSFQSYKVFLNLKFFKILIFYFFFVKVNLDIEYKQIFEIKEEDLAKKHEIEARERIESAVAKLSNERAKERKDFIRQQKAEIEILRKQSIDDIDVSVCVCVCICSSSIKFIYFIYLKSEKKSDKSSAGFYRNKFEEINSELNDLKAEISVVKESNEKLSKKLRQGESLLTEKVI
jgi:hypothetical protein